MSNSEEYNSQSLDEEIIEHDLLRPIQISGFVHAFNDSYRLLCHVDSLLGLAQILRDAGRRMQNWAIDKDAHLVHAAIHVDAQALIASA